MKNKNTIQIFRYVFLAISVLVILTAFLTSVTFNESFETDVEGITQTFKISLKYNAWSLIFGEIVPELELQDNVNQEFIVSIKPSIMIIVAYFLPILASLAMLILKKDRQVTGFIMTASFLISAILLFMTLKVCSMNIAAINGYYVAEEGTASLQSIGFKIAIGPIIGALISCIGTVTSFSFAMQKEDKK